MAGKTVGEQNGKYAFLFKVMLVTYPILAPWVVWQTSETFTNRAFRNAGNRYTATDGVEADLRLKAYADKGDEKNRDHTNERFAISHTAQRDHEKEALACSREMTKVLTDIKVDIAGIRSQMSEHYRQDDGASTSAISTGYVSLLESSAARHSREIGEPPPE